MAGAAESDQSPSSRAIAPHSKFSYAGAATALISSLDQNRPVDAAPVAHGGGSNQLQGRAAARRSSASRNISFRPTAGVCRRRGVFFAEVLRCASVIPPVGPSGEHRFSVGRAQTPASVQRSSLCVNRTTSNSPITISLSMTNRPRASRFSFRPRPPAPPRSAADANVVRLSIVREWCSKRSQVRRAARPPAEDVARALVFTEPFDFVELLLRNQAARHAFFRFGDKSGAIVVGRDVRLPRRVVALMTSPLDVPAMHDGMNLVFSSLGVPVPPTKLDAHSFCFRQ